MPARDEESDDEFKLDNHDHVVSEHSDIDNDNEDGDDKPKTEAERESQKLARITQKSLLKDRKLLKPNAPIIAQAKPIWEQLRKKNLKKPDREALMAKMMQLVQGKAKDVIFKHDASRIIQCCLKYGSQAQRIEIAQELNGSYVDLAKSQYGRFIVSRVMQLVKEHRQVILQEFHGKVRKLIRHKEASLVLDEMYSQFANAAQRISLMEEFYGPEFAIFKVHPTNQTTSGPKSLEALLESDPVKKPYILKHLRQTLDSVLEKGTFNLGRTPILHRAVSEYITHAEPAASRDLIELLKDHLVHILHTRDGAHVASWCILHSAPKGELLRLGRTY
jgi:pumilio homology domain family member 6